MSLIAELQAVAATLEGVADHYAAIGPTVSALDNASQEVGKAWSGSNLGYQARVYMAGFEAPPTGERFSQE